MKEILGLEDVIKKLKELDKDRFVVSMVERGFDEMAKLVDGTKFYQNYYIIEIKDLKLKRRKECEYLDE